MKSSLIALAPCISLRLPYIYAYTMFIYLSRKFSSWTTMWLKLHHRWSPDSFFFHNLWAVESAIKLLGIEIEFSAAHCECRASSLMLRCPTVFFKRARSIRFAIFALLSCEVQWMMMRYFQRECFYNMSRICAVSAFNCRPEDLRLVLGHLLAPILGACTVSQSSRASSASAGIHATSPTKSSLPMLLLEAGPPLARSSPVASPTTTNPTSPFSEGTVLKFPSLVSRPFQVCYLFSLWKHFGPPLCLMPIQLVLSHRYTSMRSHLLPLLARPIDLLLR